MAVDTAPKRRSAAAILPFQGPGVTPDASPDEDWRRSVGYSYIFNGQGASPFSVVSSIAASVVERIEEM